MILAGQSARQLRVTWRPSEVLMSGRMTGMQKLRRCARRSAGYSRGQYPAPLPAAVRLAWAGGAAALVLYPTVRVRARFLA